MSNLHIDQLLDIAYEIAKENFKNQQFAFTSLWSKTWKAASDFKKEPVEEWISDFYVQLQLDPRFINCPNNNLMLKEFINYSELKKMDKGIFGDEEIILDEDFEKTTVSSKKSKAHDDEKPKILDGELIEKEDIEIQDLEEKDSYNNLIDSDI